MSNHKTRKAISVIGILLTGIFLVASITWAKEARPFWTERSAFVEGDELFVVGVASRAHSVEEGRKQAFENGKVELMNYAQLTSLEAQGLVIETQMTYEEANADGTVTVYRLLRVPASKLVAIQGRLNTQSRLQEQALEQSRKELLAIQLSLAERARKIDQQQRQVEQMLQELTSKVRGTPSGPRGSQGTGSVAPGTLGEKLREAETQLDAQEQTLEEISRRARDRIAKEVERNRKRCRLLTQGMTRAEVKALMGDPGAVHNQYWAYGTREVISITFGQTGGIYSIHGCDSH